MRKLKRKHNYKLFNKIVKTKITEQVIRHLRFSKEDHRIRLIIADNDALRIETYKGNHEFIFDNRYTEETLDKWESVLKLMIDAVKLARKRILLTQKIANLKKENKLNF